MEVFEINRPLRILVTGASGFIGCKLVGRLVELGHEVTTFGRSKGLPAVLKPLDGRIREHITGDITSLESIRKAVLGADVVFHLAGFVSYRRSDREKQWEINVIGTRNVMQAALDCKVKRVIHTSSIAGMGIPAPGEIGDESITYNLEGLGLNYCDSKHAAEDVVMSFVARGLPAIILCPGIIFGEGDTHPHHRAIFMAMHRGRLTGWPKGGVTFCDINDVVDVHIKAMNAGAAGERYVVGSANLTFKEAAFVLSSVMGSKPPSFEIPGWLSELAGSFCEAVFPVFGFRPPVTRQVAWLSQRKIFFSADKAVRELGAVQTPFEETVRRTCRYYLGDKKAPELELSGKKQ